MSKPKPVGHLQYITDTVFTWSSEKDFISPANATYHAPNPASHLTDKQLTCDVYCTRLSVNERIISTVEPR